MTSFGYFGHLLTGTGEFLVFFFPVTLAAGMLFGAAVIWYWGRPRVNRIPVIAAVIVPAVIPVCLLLVGVAFVRPEYTAWGEGLHPPVPWFPEQPMESAQTAIRLVMALHLPTALALAWCAGRGWPIAVAASLWWGWVSFVAGGMAEMSVTGNWL